MNEGTCPFHSTRSTARCPGWSLASWPVHRGCTPPRWPPGGRMWHRPTAATPAPPCTPHATATLGTCTPHWCHAGTPSMSTCNTSRASPTSTARPPRGGPNRPRVDWGLPTALLADARPVFPSSSNTRETSRAWGRAQIWGGRFSEHAWLWRPELRRTLCALWRRERHGAMEHKRQPRFPCCAFLVFAILKRRSRAGTDSRALPRCYPGLPSLQLTAKGQCVHKSIWKDLLYL